MLDVALLGTGGMMPLPDRYLTALLLRLNGNMLLIDCGEGTQMTMKKLGWGFKAVEAICFTHYHADHISGLPGLLLTIGNSGREEKLKLIGPKGLKSVYRGLSVIAPELPFEVECIELENDNINHLEVAGFNISTIKGEHMISCVSYSIDVKRVGKFNVEKALKLNVPKQYWSVLQKQKTLELDGKVYTSDMVLGDDRKGIKVSYCTDTRPVSGIADFVRNSDLFICEGMYGENDKVEKAKKYKHMTFCEAAKIAKEGEVKELWLTHYSPALTDPEYFLNNATDIFKNTKAGYDRKYTTIKFDED